MFEAAPSWRSLLIGRGASSAGQPLSKTTPFEATWYAILSIPFRLATQGSRPGQPACNPVHPVPVGRVGSPPSRPVRNPVHPDRHVGILTWPYLDALVLGTGTSAPMRQDAAASMCASTRCAGIVPRRAVTNMLMPRHGPIPMRRLQHSGRISTCRSTCTTTHQHMRAGPRGVKGQERG